MPSLSQAAPSVAPDVGQPVLSEADFAALAQIIHRRTGIHLPPAKRILMQTRLAKRLRARRLDSFGAYRRLIETGTDAEEIGAMISALTTNVTRFRREPHHFDNLAQKVLPDLMAQARAGRRVRFWSAGCATGEEPYTLAFTVLAACPEAARLDVRILATDLDPEALRVAEAGLYRADALAALSIQDRAHFRPAEGRPGHHAVCGPARELIRFRRLNLIEDWPFAGGFDVILCRNVVIYFDLPTQNRLWCRFAAHQRRAGDRLYIGHSESLSEAARRLYRPVDGVGYARTATPVTEGEAQPTPQQAGER
ncbi:MAG: CheR family methyltransferase [Alkalilacustris sp.]